MKQLPGPIVAASLVLAAVADGGPEAARAAACASEGALDPVGLFLGEILCGNDPIDADACMQAVFGSPLDLLTVSYEVAPGERKAVPTIASGFANALTGGNRLSAVVLESLAGGVSVPVVTLAQDPCDSLRRNGDGSCGPTPGNTPHLSFASEGRTIHAVLSDEQEALIGCGPGLGTDCEGEGIDWLAAARPVLTQSWVGFDGSCARTGAPDDWHLANGRPLPGTVGYAAPLADPPAGARPMLLPDGVTPNPEHDPGRDGTSTGLVVPAAFGRSAGQAFASEMAALSFNLQLVLVAFSAPARGLEPERDQLDPGAPYAIYDPDDPGTAGNRGRCSFAQPQHCRTVRALLAPEPAPALAGAYALAALAALARSRSAASPEPR